MLSETREKLQAYSGKELQHMIHLLNYFESIGSDIPTMRAMLQDVFNGMVAEHKTKMRKLDKVSHNLIPIRCVVCGSIALVYPVNDAPETIVGGDYKSVVQCLNDNCFHQEYSNKEINEYRS